MPSVSALTQFTIFEASYSLQAEVPIERRLVQLRLTMYPGGILTPTAYQPVVKMLEGPRPEKSPYPADWNGSVAPPPHCKGTWYRVPSEVSRNFDKGSVHLTHITGCI